MTPVRVIGIGTAFGDDRAGLALAERLAAAPLPDCEIVATDRPAAELLELLSTDGAVILLDAVRSRASAGTIHDLAIEDLPAARLGISSHGLGLSHALDLCRVLGRPVQGRFIGIEAAAGGPAAVDRLGPAVAAALPTAVDRARAWVEWYCGRGPLPSPSEKHVPFIER